MELGFRSSFNLIPEGSYQVDTAFCDDLKSNGFEVGVHDLRHDGKLYLTRTDFSANAARSGLPAWENRLAAVRDRLWSDVAWRRLKSQIAAVIVWARRPTSLDVCRRWLPVWLPEF